MSESTERAIRYLSRSPLLQGVSEEVLRIIEPPPEMISLKAGDTLIRQDEESTDYFVLVSGRLRVFNEQDGRLTPIGVVLPGEGVGEMALLTNEPRMATVIARLDSEVVRFPQSTFLVLAGGQPLTVLNIARTVISRSMGRHTSNANRVSDYPSIAILPLTADIDTRLIAEKLTLELNKYGRSCAIDATFKGSLDELEERFEFVVYSAGAQPDSWARSCLLRADLVLLAASITGSAEPLQLESELLHSTDHNIVGRVDLLLLHPSRWHSDCGASRWIERLKPREFHHLRSDDGTDMARLARIIVGRANNLVLSGGGVRAFAQIGAVRALGEFGIPVDRIAGCSMGAAMGAMCALDDQFEERVRESRRLFLQRRPGRDFTLPLLSLMSGKKLTDIATNLFGASKIEDLPKRYFCVSSDLAAGEIVEHSTGLIWQALRATAAIPVIAPPLLRDGRFLVDGGVLNNLPIDIMRQRFSGNILAIDVSRPEPLVVDSRWEMKSPSGFEILRNGFGRARKRVGLPNIFEVLRRTITLASERQAQQARPQADLLFAPPVWMFRLTDFASFDRIVEIGYRYTIEALTDLEKNSGGFGRVTRLN